MSFKVIFVGKIKRDNWDCFAWSVHLKDQTFDYYTGLGHATKSVGYMGLKPKTLARKVIRSTNDRDEVIFIHIPKLKDVLHALALDCTNENFHDWCSNFGCSTDSRKALETYLLCQENEIKLRKVLKSKNAIERIQAWGL